MEYIKHLSRDKILKKVIRQVGPIALKKGTPVYLRLCESIVSQQLSVKAADTIFGRFLELFPSREPMPQQILDTPLELLRGAGLSNAKARYLQNVAKFELEEGMGVDRLNTMTNDEVIAYLMQIKGVGRWTVEMLLMFVLAREDVFAVDDIGIQRSMAKLYALNRKHKKFKGKLTRLSANWSPYRTYACIYLWRWKG